MTSAPCTTNSCLKRVTFRENNENGDEVIFNFAAQGLELQTLRERADGARMRSALKFRGRDKTTILHPCVHFELVLGRFTRCPVPL